MHLHHHITAALRRRRAAAAALTALGATMGALALPGAADAGVYSYAPCRGFAGASFGDSSGGWTGFGAQFGSITDNCTNGGGSFRMEYWPTVDLPMGPAVGASFRAPANTRIREFNGAWTGWVRSWDGNESGMLRIEGDGFALLAADSGTFTSPNGFGVAGLDGGRLDAWIDCRTVSVCRADGWNYGWLALTDPIVTLTDNAAPAAGTIYGSAVTDDKWVGTERLDFAATDRGGGLHRINTYVDGNLRSSDAIGDRNGGRCAVGTAGPTFGYLFGSPIPCALSVSTYTETPTTTLEDGQHAIAFKVEDVAGNEMLLYSATKLVANHPPVNVTRPTRARAWAAQFDAPAVGTAFAMADSGTWTGPNLVMSSTWLRCDVQGDNCTPIPGATDLAYTPTVDDVGHRLRYSVTATNVADAVTVMSDPSGVVTTPRSSGEIITKPPADGAAGTNGAPGTSGGNGAGGSNGTNGSTSTVSIASHTLVGHVVGEPEGTSCPSDKATVVVQHVRGATLKLGNGRHTTAQVQLTCTNTGKAIAGAKLELATRVGARAAVAADVTTDGAGHATLRIAKGPSRTITVGYRMYADDPMVRATAMLKVTVDAKVALRADHRRLRNGQAVTLSGTLAGGEIPKRGVTLAVQWRDGRRWRPFAQIKTTRNGAFKYAYRFTRTRRPIKYQLRVAVTKGQVDYPYVARASKAVKVTVAP